MSELNPEHPVTKEMHDQWHKVCALLMLKLGKFTVEITVEDAEKLQNLFPGHEPTVMVDTPDDRTMRLRLMPEMAALAEVMREKLKVKP